MPEGIKAKSGSTRYVPVNKEAFDILNLWREQQGVQSEMIFPSKDGKRFCEAKRSWKRVLKMAGIENFRWHDMRHHFACRLVMAGGDLNTVRDLLGLSDLKIAVRYAHLSPEVKAKAVARLDELSVLKSMAPEVAENIQQNRSIANMSPIGYN